MKINFSVNPLFCLIGSPFRVVQNNIILTSWVVKDSHTFLNDSPLPFNQRLNIKSIPQIQAERLTSSKSTSARLIKVTHLVRPFVGRRLLRSLQTTAREKNSKCLQLTVVETVND